jgi:hypothetical protein
MSERGWVVELPGGVCEMHCFDSTVTQGNNLTQRSVTGVSEVQATSSSPGNKRKRPLGQANQGCAGGRLSPAKKQKPYQVKGVLRKPNKVVRGNALAGGCEGGFEKFLDTRPITRDVLNELSDSYADKENMEMYLQDHMDEFMSADLDDFGI